MAVGEILSGTTFGDGDLDVFIGFAGTESIREIRVLYGDRLFHEDVKIELPAAREQKTSDQRSCYVIWE